MYGIYGFYITSPNFYTWKKNKKSIDPLKEKERELKWYVSVEVNNAKHSEKRSERATKKRR
jgi:hypothetical protein